MNVSINKKPKALEMQQEHIGPDFLVGDVIESEKRHVIFSTPLQMSVLAKSSR